MKITASALAFALAASVTLISTTAATSLASQVTLPSATTQAVPDINLSETPAWADRFVDSIGFDASYENHTYPALVTQELEWSGVRHLRDGAPTSALMIATFAELGKHGINHSIGMLRNFTASDLKARLAAFSPYIDYVEPANEADNFIKPNWAQMRADQQRLWTTVRSNKAWNNVAVLGPSFADPASHAALVGPLDSYEDFGVLHNATCDWNPGTDISWVSIDSNTVRIRPTTKYKPIWTTETGYGDDRSRGCSLPDDIIAKYVTRTSTERWLHGEPRTYISILVDRPSDITFGSLGLLNPNGTPKPQFVALGNLVRLLADRGTAPKATKVAYTISNATSDVHHLLLARSDGTYDLLLYRETPCWDHHTRTRIPVTTENVHITVPGMKNAEVYKYQPGYNFSLAALTVNQSHQTAVFPVSDAITVIHFGF